MAPRTSETPAADPPRTVLVTGAAGRVGSAIRPYLRDRYALRLFDRVPVPVPHDQETVVVGDLVSPDAVRGAVYGVDAVVHLACVHGLALRFEDSIDVNFRGMMHLLDAMRAAGIDRLVYASSHHVLGLHPRDGFAGDDASPAPDAVYGLGKAFGELACTTYALRYGIRTLIVRIGNADPTVADDRALQMWTSARDLAQLISIGLESPDVVCDVVYGVSICPDPLFRNRRARGLGYRPEDRAEEHLDPDFLPYDAMPPHLGRAYVGGAYAAADLPVPEEA